MASKTFRLRHLTPSHLTTMLASPQPGAKSLLDGIDGIRTDDLRHEVSFSGKPEAVRGMEQLIALLDKRPQVAVVHLRLIHSETLIDGPGIDWRMAAPSKPGIEPVALSELAKSAEPRATLVSEAKLRVTNNSPVEACLLGGEQILKVSATPHINGDRTVSLLLDVQESGGAKYSGFRRLREDRLLLLSRSFAFGTSDGLYLLASAQRA